MKILSDKTEIEERVYFYVVDFNQADENSFLLDNFGKMRVCDLKKEEFIKTFKHATENDLSDLNN